MSNKFRLQYLPTSPSTTEVVDLLGDQIGSELLAHAARVLSKNSDNALLAERLCGARFGSRELLRLRDEYVEKFRIAGESEGRYSLPVLNRQGQYREDEACAVRIAEDVVADVLEYLSMLCGDRAEIQFEVGDG